MDHSEKQSYTLSIISSAAADNSQLLAENRALKIQCNNYHEKYHSLRDVHFQNQLRFHDLEEIRDKLYESNQKHKINNNKYLDMIRKQAERIRQMENSLKVQTMRGSMIRNSVGGESSILFLLNRLFSKSFLQVPFWPTNSPQWKT